MMKGCSFANAARNGVFSSLLAREGMTGPSPIFEGEMGFFKQVSGPFTVNTDDFGGIQGSFKIAETYLKYFPAEIHSQTSIWAALEARKEIDNPDDIVSMEIASHEAGYTILGRDPEKWNPMTKETADHSLPYIVAMALLTGKIDNSTYTEKNYRDPKILDFLKKITVVEDKELSTRYPEAVANRITVKLSDGRTITKQVDYHKGHPKNPMTDKEVEEKFQRLTKKYMGQNQSRRILDTVWNLDKLKDTGKAISLLTLR
jgi:2-methylcitrate dehydratase